MTQIDIAERFRRIVEDGIGGGDESVLEAYLAPDLIEHQRGNPPGLDEGVVAGQRPVDGARRRLRVGTQRRPGRDGRSGCAGPAGRLDLAVPGPGAGGV
jgi:hypothetical protein